MTNKSFSESQGLLMLEQTAYHEAGHLVAAYRFNHYIGRITIEPDGSILGSCYSEEEWGGNLESYKEQIVVLYAGFAAESIYNSKADPAGSYRDDERAKELLDFIPEGSERLLRDQSFYLCRENWPQIEALAAALLEHKTLQEDEATIIIDARDEGEDWAGILIEYKRRRDCYLEKK